MTDPSAFYRTFRPDLEIRSTGGGRTIVGIAVPWRVPSQITDTLREEFIEGAFDHQLRALQRVRFAREHVDLGGTLIGATRELRNDAAGLYGEWWVSRTPIGDETLELVKDGALSDLSIGFTERQNRHAPDGTVQRVTADLFEVAVTLEGAYGQLAGVGGVRSLPRPTAPAGATTANLAAARRILAALPLLPPPAA